MGKYLAHGREGAGKQINTYKLDLKIWPTRLTELGEDEGKLNLRKRRGARDLLPRQ